MVVVLMSGQAGGVGVVVGGFLQADGFGDPVGYFVPVDGGYPGKVDDGFDGDVAMVEPAADLVGDDRSDVFHPDHPGAGMGFAVQDGLEGLAGQVEVDDGGAEHEGPPVGP